VLGLLSEGALAGVTTAQVALLRWYSANPPSDDRDEANPFDELDEMPSRERGRAALRLAPPRAAPAPPDDANPGSLNAS
jgi:hypothetical protein